MSQKSENLAKIEAIFSTRGHLDADQMRAGIQDSISAGTLKPLPESYFEGKPLDLIAFAKDYGLIKGKRGAAATGNGHPKGAFRLIEQMLPAECAALKAAMEPFSKPISVPFPDGRVRLIAFQPYFRDVTNGTSQTTGAEATAGTPAAEGSAEV